MSSLINFANFQCNMSDDGRVHQAFGYLRFSTLHSWSKNLRITGIRGIIIKMPSENRLGLCVMSSKEQRKKSGDLVRCQEAYRQMALPDLRY